MPDNNAYTQYINQIRDVLLNTLYAPSEFGSPEAVANECITLLQKQWKEIGLTPEVFNPFLKQFITDQAIATGAGTAGGSFTPSRTSGGTARSKL